MRPLTMIMVIAVMVLAILSTFTTAQEEEWKFREFLLDRTDYFDIATVLPGADGTITFDETLPTRKVFITSNSNETITDLAVVSFINNTQTNPSGDISGQFKFDIVFDAKLNNTGSFTIELPEQKPTTVNFIFSVVNKVAIASGKWNDVTNYQITVPQKDRFILTLFDAKNGSIKKTLVATKVAIPIEKTFWSQYGTYILMAVMLFFNMYMQKPKEEGEQEGAEGAVHGPQPPPAATTAQPKQKQKAKKD